jgi:hypothetical protein
LRLLGGDSEAVAIDVDTGLELAHLCQEMGRLSFRTGDNQEAVEWTGRALQQAERAAGLGQGDADRSRTAAAAISHAHNTLGAALARLDRPAEAVRHMERSVAVAEAAGLLQAACRSYANLGVLYATLDPGRAVQTCRLGLETAQKIGDLGFQSRLYANLAVAYCALTQRCDDDGLRAAQSAIDLDRQLGQIDHLAVPLIVLGQIHQCHGEFEKALRYYEEARGLAEEMGEPQLMFPCYEGWPRSISTRATMRAPSSTSFAPTRSARRPESTAIRWSCCRSSAEDRDQRPRRSAAAISSAGVGRCRCRSARRAPRSASRRPCPRRRRGSARRAAHVRRQDRLIGRFHLEALLRVEDGVGVDRLQRLVELAGRVDARRHESRQVRAIRPLPRLAAVFGQEIDSRHAEGAVRGAIRVAQQHRRRRPMAEVHARALDRGVDDGDGLDACRAQRRLDAGELHHLAAAERAVQAPVEADQERPPAQVAHRDVAFAIGCGQRELRHRVSGLQRPLLLCHRMLLVWPARTMSVPYLSDCRRPAQCAPAAAQPARPRSICATRRGTRLLVLQ